MPQGFCLLALAETETHRSLRPFPLLAVAAAVQQHQTCSKTAWLVGLAAVAPETIRALAVPETPHRQVQFRDMPVAREALAQTGTEAVAVEHLKLAPMPTAQLVLVEMVVTESPQALADRQRITPAVAVAALVAPQMELGDLADSVEAATEARISLEMSAIRWQAP